MIISGKQFREGVTNRSAPIDAFFPRTSIWKSCKTGWVDQEGKDTFAISFMDNDHIQINNNLLNILGWSKKDSNSYLEIIESYIHDGYTIIWLSNPVHQNIIQELSLHMERLLFRQIQIIMNP